MPENLAIPGFETLLKKLPVTSIRVSNQYVIAGIGGYLVVFDSSKFTQINKVNILDNITIHGISQNGNKSLMCVFGGYHIAVLQTDSDSFNLRFQTVNKWRTADWVLCCKWVRDKAQLAVLSAHNVLTLWDAETAANLAQVFCTEKCILYSATVLDGTWKDMVVIAGTVFQQIIIWATGVVSKSDRPVMHKLCGHKGVIFSVTYDERSHLISSTSDDRSVRVWSVVSNAHGPLTAEDWKCASITLLFTIFGHTARVWQSYILPDNKIISIGEDSMLCVWRVSGECVSQRETHQGTGAWCLDIDESQSLVFTGGADGSINMWPLHPSSPVCRSLHSPIGTPRRIALLLGCRVVTVTEAGSLMVYEDQTWSTVYQHSKISNYCLLEVSPSRELIGLASIKGHIIVLRSSNFAVVLESQVCEEKIFSLHWLNEDTLLSCHNQGNLFVWRISSSVLEKLGVVHLPPYKERWTTAAVLCSSTIVYGDRVGNIHCSCISHPRSDHSDDVKTISRAHSRLGVSSLSLIDDYIWSTGRDGIVKKFAVSNHNLTLISSTKLPFDWVAQVISISSHTNPAVICFHESNVVLWSIKQRQKLISLQCGGGHRSWSYLVEQDQFFFTYLKNKTAHILQFSLFEISGPTIMEGFHAKEINSMTHIVDNWFVTGGEDGSVRLSQLYGSEWSTPVVESNHLSSVRSVEVFTFKQQTLIFSAGGRAQLKMWKINLESQCSLTEISTLMLRNEKRGRHWLNTVPEPDPETRFMDVHTFKLSDTALCVLAACSDAFMRIFYFDANSNELCLRKTIKTRKHCILRITSLQFKNDLRVAITTATDGFVSFWNLNDIEEDVKPFTHERLHQSGVNGLSVFKVGECDMLLATGGDDNTLSIVNYSLKSDSESQLSVCKMASWTNSFLHSSVITGVLIVGEWIVCSGGDQRVTLLSWSITDDLLSVSVLTQCYCSVPDIKGLATVHNEKDNLIVCVYGAGLEVLELYLKKR